MGVSLAAVTSGSPIGGQALAKLRAGSLALMFAAGGGLGLLAVALPHGPNIDVRMSVATSVSGLVTAAALVTALVTGERHVPTWLLGALLATGTAMTTLGIAAGHGGGPAVAAAFFYVWVALYAFAFFDLPAAAAQLCFAGVSYAAVLAVQADRSGPADWVLVLGTAATVGGVVGLFRRQLTAAARVDPLTGVANRQALVEFLGRELARAQRSQQPMVLALLDLVNFKQVNDTEGHLAGDRRLVAFAAHWSGGLRRGDLFARYGGDEFVAVLIDTTVPAALERLETLVRSAPTTCRFGLATAEAADDTTGLLARADASLCRATRRGARTLMIPEPRPTTPRTAVRPRLR